MESMSFISEYSEEILITERKMNTNMDIEIWKQNFKKKQWVCCLGKERFRAKMISIQAKRLQSARSRHSEEVV
jgi:hypothetical protein